MFDSFKKVMNMPDGSPESWAPVNTRTLDRPFFAGTQTYKGGLGVGAYRIQAQISSGRPGTISSKSKRKNQLTCPDNLPKDVNTPGYMRPGGLKIFILIKSSHKNDDIAYYT